MRNWKIKHIDKCLYLYRFGDNWSNTTFARNASIQHHVAHVRNNYAKEIIEFNNRRLASSKKLSVVIADWNTKDLTLRCIDSVRKHNPPAEIVLVQNGEKFDSVNIDKVIPMETNVGFAAAINRGVMEATGEFICILNSDTVVNEGLLDKLVEEAAKPGIGVVAPYSNNARPPQGNNPEEIAKTLPTLHLPSVVGVCMVMRRSLYNAAEGMDTSLCNFEDDDLCTKLRNAGYKSIVVGGTWIHHEGNASFNKNGESVNARLEASRILYKKKWPKVAAVAITLNEVNTLPGYFGQYVGRADYFGILDSGSTDGTVEWAKKNNVEVHTRKFDNFESQRNAAIAMVPPDTEWIIMHDPDERMDKNTLENIWELTRDDRYDMYYSPLQSENYDGSHTEWVAKPFLFRNRECIRWVFPVHEKLIGSYKQAIVTNAMNTHYLKMHDPSRRKSMEELYASLGQDGGELGDWPILNYHKRSDPRIIPVVLGPRVSVIIPTYRRKELLRRAVESAKNQDYLAKDIIIIGDNDPDFVNIDNCLCINLPNNHGAGGAVPRNYGLIMAKNDWIAYLDDDNEWKPNHLSSLMLAAQKAGAEFAVASLDVEGKTLLCDRIERGKVDTSVLLHKKDLINRFGWWSDRTEKGYAHDWEFVRPWAAAGVSHVCTKLPTVVYNRRTSGQSDYLANLLGLPK
jgi:GT2 family glycosyltransferase